jgi:hypothetical protein
MDDTPARRFFLQPTANSQRLYEALRAVCLEDYRQKDVAERFGYDYAAFRQPVRFANLLRCCGPQQVTQEREWRIYPLNRGTVSTVRCPIDSLSVECEAWPSYCGHSTNLWLMVRLVALEDRLAVLAVTRGATVTT